MIHSRLLWPAGLPARHLAVLDCIPLLTLQHGKKSLLQLPSPALLLVLALACTNALAASAVHRCESGGKLNYSDLPCPGATAISIDEAPPAEHNVRASDASQQRQAAELARLQQLRELRERQDQRIRDLAARGAAAREKKCQALAMQRRWREEDLRDASLKQEANARKRLRRTEERFRDECR